METNMVNPTSPTAYDDVFRTMLVDCRHLVIPVVNEVFDEHYSGEEKVVFKANEHFQRQQDGNEDKKITDSNFVIIGDDNEEKDYLFECQSTADKTIVVRIFEYEVQIAIEGAEMIGDDLIVTIPKSAVLFLRSTKNTSDKMKIEIRTSGGNVAFDVEVVKVKDYSIDEIFEKKLFFLIPFYIFNYESNFEEMEKNAEKLSALREQYLTILNRLEAAVKEGLISTYDFTTIKEMSNKVIDKLAEKYQNVREGVKTIMGGRVLDHEAKTIKNEGLQEGRQEGRQEGLQEGRQEGRQEEKSKMVQLMQWLFAAGRSADLERASNDPAFLDQLLQEYSLKKI